MVGKHYGFTVMLSTPSILQSSWVRGRLASLFAFQEKHSLGRMVTCPGTLVGTAGMDILGPCSVSKEPACAAGDSGSIPGSGRAPGEGNGYPLQYSCRENYIDRGA